MSAPEQSPEDFRFVVPLRVRWTEVDMQGVVFFGHYYAYFDLGMTEYFRALGYPYPHAFVDATTDVFTKHSECEYHGSARYDDCIDVAVRVARMGRSSLSMAFRITRGADLLTTGGIVYVFADPNTRESTPIPEALRAAVTAYEPALQARSNAASP